MRPQYRRYSIYLLLGICTSIATLGEGLHLLSPHACVHHHHHHHGCCIVASSKHGSTHDDHDLVACEARGHVCECTECAECAPALALAVVADNDQGTQAHTCGICAFLFQSIGQPAEAASTFDWQPLVVAAPCRLQLMYLPTPLGLHAPRGPPILG